MKHNVFESGNDKAAGPVLTHADIEAIVADASKMGSLKEAVEGYALSHGIQDIDVLFPEAKAIASSPEATSTTSWSPARRYVDTTSRTVGSSSTTSTVAIVTSPGVLALTRA